MIVLVAAVPAETDIIRERFALMQGSTAFPETWTSASARGSRKGSFAVAHAGIGKALAAATTALIIEQLKPTTIVMIGSAGAYPTGKLRIGDLAVATEENFADEGAISPEGFLTLSTLNLPLATQNQVPLYERLPLEQNLNMAIKTSLSEWGQRENIQVAFGPFATVSSCSGTDRSAREMASRTGAVVENMEGAAAALVAHRMGIRFIELRAVSNIAENRDFSTWDLPLANRTAQMAALTILPQLQHEK